MQQLRQHTFGCGHCALCVAAKSVFALFAGFLTLALTFASTLILSSVLFTSPAFAQVNAENSGSAASAQTAATTQNASNKTAGQSDSAATANAGNTSEKANAALATNSASTSKNAGSAAASGASSTAQNAANNGAANAGQEAANNSNSQANPKTFSITYIVDGKSATTDGVAGTIKLATLESKTVNGVSYTFLGWKLEDGTLLKGGTDFEMTKDVTLTAEWKVESANGSTSIDTITDQDSSNSAINGENPGQGDLPETDNGNKGPDAPDYVVLPNEGESNSQVNDGNSSSNSQVTNTTPPQNQGGTATSPGNSGTTLPNSSGSSVSSSNNSNSSSAKDLTASPNAPPVNAPKNSSISAASESNKANLAAQATPTENPFSATLKNVFWSWDPVSGTLTIGNIGTNTATINIGAFTASTLPWLTAADGAAPQAIKHIVTKQNAYTGQKFFNTVLTEPTHRDTSISTSFYAVSGSKKADTPFVSGKTVGDVLDQIFKFRNSTTVTYSANYWAGFDIIEEESADPNKVTITYDGNKPAAATGTVSGVPANGSGSKDGNTPFTVSSDVPTLAGYKFNGWNTQANGGGTSYAAGATIPGASITGDITLYAQWIQQLSITFNANGTGVTGLPSTITVDYNAATSIPSSAPTRANFTFKGWNTAANGSGTAYTAGQSIAHLTTNLPLYAQWEAYPVVTYNANSGTGAPSADTVAPGVYNIKTGTPTRTGYVFGGWTPTQNSTANGLYSYNATISGSQRSMNVTSNVTLYALWNPVVTYSAGTAPAGAKDTITNMPSTTTYTVTYNGTHTVLTTPTPHPFGLHLRRLGEEHCSHY